MKRFKHQKQRGRYIEVRLRLPSGEWKWTKIDCVKGQEAEADHVRQEAQAQIDAGEPVMMALGPLTVERYVNEVFLPWCQHTVDGRVRIRDWENYRGILELWVLPQIGPLSLANVRRKNILSVINHVRRTDSARGKPVSARRVLNIYGVMQSLFRNAVVDEVIAHNPCTLTRDPRGCGDLPVVEDADPEWRAKAIFAKACSAPAGT